MNQEIQLYLFRHGETDWNRDHRFQGHTDIPLNEKGRAQAITLAQQISTLSLDVLVTSDLMRAKETAFLVNQKLQLPIFESDQLRECRLGDPEGMYRDKIVETYGAPAWQRWLSIQPEDHDFGFANGETKRVHLTRLQNYLESFCRENPQFQKIGVSTHGGSVRRLVHHCENSPTSPIALPNCALYRVSYSPTPSLWKYGEMLSESGDSNVWAKPS